MKRFGIVSPRCSVPKSETRQNLRRHILSPRWFGTYAFSVFQHGLGWLSALYSLHILFSKIFQPSALQPGCGKLAPTSRAHASDGCYVLLPGTISLAVARRRNKKKCFGPFEKRWLIFYFFGRLCCCGFPKKLTNLPNDHSPRIQSMDYLHAFGYARSQSVRPCYLRSDHDFCMYFRQFIFRLISDKFRQSMGNSRWPCHGLSRSVTAFSDNAQDLSIVFCLLSRFVTVCHATC